MLRIVKGHQENQIQPQQIQIKDVINLQQKNTPSRRNIIKMTIKQPEFTQKFASQDRKEQNIIIFILILIATLLSSGQSIIQYNTPTNWASRQVKFAVNGGMQLLEIVIFSISCLTLVKWRQTLRLFLLVDNILAAQIATIFVMVTLTVLTNSNEVQWNDIVDFILTPLSLHIQSTNFRILCCHVKWNRVNVVIYKLSLLLMVIFYLGQGCFFFIISYKYTGGIDSSLDQKVFQFMVLYTCTNFAYYLELFSKLTDFDGTAEMKSEYYLSKIGQDWVLSTHYIEDQRQDAQNLGIKQNNKKEENQNGNENQNVNENGGKQYHNDSANGLLK